MWIGRNSASKRLWENYKAQNHLIIALTHTHTHTHMSIVLCYTEGSHFDRKIENKDIDMASDALLLLQIISSKCCFVVQNVNNTIFFSFSRVFFWFFSFNMIRTHTDHTNTRYKSII